MTVSRRAADEVVDADGLAYALSHDLRARLRAATGFLELARVDVDAAETVYFLDRAAAAAELADQMIERLVRYLRIDPVADVVATDPAEVIADAVARCPDAPDTIVNRLPNVMADRNLLLNAVVEVLDNAARYRAVDRAPIVRVTGGVEGALTLLRFSDNGFGINADRVDRAFEFFRQVHRVGDSPGSGMGLLVARRSIESQGGTMSLSPGPDRGAVVEVRLPTPVGV